MANTKKVMKERVLYESVQRWAERYFGCFATAVNKGTKHGRVDVLGLRQVPGDHSSETDLVCIEVKRGTQPLLNAMGQAFGYSVYGDYCYLADYRPTEAFLDIERDLAERLGVGLIRVRDVGRVELVSSARRQHPLQDFKLQLADQLGYVKCTLCRTYFRRNKGSQQKYGFTSLVRYSEDHVRVARGVREGKGLMFWPEDASANDRTHDLRHDDGKIYNRRFACHSCAQLVLGSHYEG